MYSLMSPRTSACSSSNRTAARARASSVLPTPVGPRNRNEPIGRRGSLSPARARRKASDTAAMASSWPPTRPGGGPRGVGLSLAAAPVGGAPLHPDELLELPLHQAGDRDPGPGRDDARHIV